MHAGAAYVFLLLCSALAACFSFAAGGPEAWLKVGSLRHTCGLDVQFAKNIHPLLLLLPPKLHQRFQFWYFAKHTFIDVKLRN